MVINREIKQVQVLSYPNTVDAYGQKRTGTPTRRTVDMVVKIYNQQNVNNPYYNDIELIGLTSDKGITDSNRIEIDSKTYNIKFVIPSGRYTQVFMIKA